MKVMLLVFSLIISMSVASAQTPFTLTGVKKLSILVEDYSGLKLDKKLLQAMQTMMSNKLKKTGLRIEKYNNNVLALMIKSQKFGTVQTLTLELILGGQVYRENTKALVFGLTYHHSDTIEVEDLQTDVMDSLEFLLSEFSDQFIEDQKE